MSKAATQEELDALLDRLTWRDDDPVFTRLGRNLNRVDMRGMGTDAIRHLLEADEGLVLRCFESRDGVLFSPTPACPH
jgi:hypothetical protein